MMRRSNKTVWLITFVCVILGFFVVKALEGPNIEMEIGGVTSLETIEKLMSEKKALENRKAELDEIIKDYDNKLAQYEAGAADKSRRVQQLQEEIQATRLTAGLLPVKGPGIEIVLNDRKRDSFLDSDPYIMNYFIVHDSDMLHVINELRGAGAEAIAINGTRIMATSRISCGGPTINVGKSERFTPPFVIHAIGNPDELMAAFQREDSIYHSLAAWGLEFHIRRMDSVEIPRYIGDIEFTYAKSIQAGD